MQNMDLLDWAKDYDPPLARSTTDALVQVPSRSPGRRGQRAEYSFYWGIIFLATLPFASLAALSDVTRSRSLQVRGPLNRASHHADTMTPMIFSA